MRLKHWIINNQEGTHKLEKKKKVPSKVITDMPLRWGASDSVSVAAFIAFMKMTIVSDWWRSTVEWEDCK